MHWGVLNRRIKEAFSHVKADISQIKAQLAQIEGKIDKFIEDQAKIDLKPQIFPSETVSTGNEGVYSRTHALFNHSNIQPIIHSDTQQNSHFLPNFDIEKLFQALTNKEFLVFLSVFQTERTTYEQIATKLALTSGCVRSYVSSLIKKNAPIIKKKLKNQKVILSIDNNFKTLTSEQKLTNLYYSSVDPDQTTLI